MEQKTVILSAIDNSNKKAVLNIEKFNDQYIGKLRLYNFKEKPKGILTLGFLIENKVYKSALTEKADNLFSFTLEEPSSISKFSCALVNIMNANATPVLVGVSEGQPTIDLSQKLAQNFSLLDDKELSVSNVEKCLNESQIDYDDEEKEAISNKLDEALNCTNCRYRNAFYCDSCSSKSVTEYKEPVTKKQDNNFYDEIKEQLATLFEKYPEETFLTEIIPDSKWVKVDYEDNGQYFVVGLIYEDEKVAYVCYATPGEFSKEPPKEFEGLSQWLPLDPDKPHELGYWIMYQDAESGQNVEIKIS